MLNLDKCTSFIELTISWNIGEIINFLYHFQIIPADFLAFASCFLYHLFLYSCDFLCLSPSRWYSFSLTLTALFSTFTTFLIRSFSLLRLFSFLFMGFSFLWLGVSLNLMRIVDT